MIIRSSEKLGRYLGIKLLAADESDYSVADWGAGLVHVGNLQAVLLCHTETRMPLVFFPFAFNKDRLATTSRQLIGELLDKYDRFPLFLQCFVNEAKRTRFCRIGSPKLTASIDELALLLKGKVENEPGIEPVELSDYLAGSSLKSLQGQSPSAFFQEFIDKHP